MVSNLVSKEGSYAYWFWFRSSKPTTSSILVTISTPNIQFRTSLSSRQKAILDSYFQRCRFDFQSQVHVNRQTGMFSKWKNILQLLLLGFDGIVTQRKETNSRCIDSHFKGEISKDVALPWSNSNLRLQPCLILYKIDQSQGRCTVPVPWGN